jgi:hypothetical protein
MFGLTNEEVALDGQNVMKAAKSWFGSWHSGPIVDRE